MAKSYEIDNFGNAHLACGSKVYASGRVQVDAYGNKTVKKTGLFFLAPFLNKNEKGVPQRDVIMDNDGPLYFQDIPDAIRHLSELRASGQFKARIGDE